jgi:hypothetical protein
MVYQAREFFPALCVNGQLSVAANTKRGAIFANPARIRAGLTNKFSTQ